jgi:hypothetical protein
MRFALDRAHIWLRMTYFCCGIAWTDDWPEPLKLECPDCGELVEAHLIAELDAHPKELKPRKRLGPAQRVA